MGEEYINDFYKIITNKYDSVKSLNKDTIYDEILKREKGLLEILNRITEYKEKEEKEKNDFMSQNIKFIFKNIFVSLNDLLNDITKNKKITYKKLKKKIMKKHRIMYIGLFLVIISIFMMMIEISDGA
jgi:Fe2+ transport system protein B